MEKWFYISCYFALLLKGIFNMKVNINETVDNQTHIAHVSKDRQTCRLEKLPSTETRCALLANVYYTEGKPGPVVRVRCKIRKGDDNFITKCRLVLAQHYGEKVVGKTLSTLFLFDILSS